MKANKYNITYPDLSKSLQTEKTNEILSKLRVGKKGKPLSSDDNVLRIVMEDPLFVNNVRFNDLTGSIEIINFGNFPDFFYPRKDILHWANENALTTYISNVYGISSYRTLRVALQQLARVHSYNPIVRYLSSLPEYDGNINPPAILRDIFEISEVFEFVEAYLKNLMLSMIYRVYGTGYQQKYFFVLVSPNIGPGKSAFLQWLAKENSWYELVYRYSDFKENLNFKRGKWLVELSDMTGHEDIGFCDKDFFCRPVDIYKNKYDNYDEDCLRQFVFACTSNSYDFLLRSDNRMYMCLTIHSDNYWANEKLQKLIQEKDGKIIDGFWSWAMKSFRYRESVFLEKEIQKKRISRLYQ